MRVLYFNYEWDPRDSPGALTHIRELSRELGALGHTVIVQHRHRSPEAKQDEGHSKPPGSVYRVSRLRKWLSPYLHESAALCRAISGIGSEITLIQKARPDVVLTRSSLHQFSSLLAARRCGIPVVFEVNAPAAYEYRRYRSQYFLVPGFAEWLETRILSRADGMFVVSDLLKKHFVEEGIPEGKIRVVPNGVDISRFRPDAGNAEIRNRLGAKSIIVGFVGSFSRFHGIDQLRSAIEYLVPLRENTRFLMVGAGDLSADLQEYCRQLGLSGRVHFTGHVPAKDVPGLMAAADILLAPYQAQDFFYFSPIKIFEYMATARAVVAARVGQIPEIIQDGVNGMVYDPSAPGALGERLLRLVDHPELRRRLGEEARRTVESHYTWQNSAAGVIAALEQAMNCCRTRTN